MERLLRSWRGLKVGEPSEDGTMELVDRFCQMLANGAELDGCPVGPVASTSDVVTERPKKSPERIPLDTLHS